MPDTKGQSGIEHFEAYAKTLETTSSDGRFSTYKVTKGTGGDGPIVQQERGEPSEPKKKAKK